MQRYAYDRRFMALAATVAAQSRCAKRQVGAVLSQGGQVVATGCNGPLAGTHDCATEWPGVGCARDLHGGCSLALHAEQNAIVAAWQGGSKVQGGTLYVTLAPCLPCARLICGVGIRQVVYAASYAAYKGLAREEGVDLLQQVGVHVGLLKHPK